MKMDLGCSLPGWERRHGVLSETGVESFGVVGTYSLVSMING